MKWQYIAISPISPCLDGETTTHTIFPPKWRRGRTTARPCALWRWFKRSRATTGTHFLQQVVQIRPLSPDDASLQTGNVTQVLTEPAASYQHNSLAGIAETLLSPNLFNLMLNVLLRYTARNAHDANDTATRALLTCRRETHLRRQFILRRLC